MKYRLSPNAEISTTVTDGEELRLEFDKDGIVEVPDDFQEATAVLEAHPDVKHVREKS